MNLQDKCVGTLGLVNATQKVPIQWIGTFWVAFIFNPSIVKLCRTAVSVTAEGYKQNQRDLWPKSNLVHRVLFALTWGQEREPLDLVKSKNRPNLMDCKKKKRFNFPTFYRNLSFAEKIVCNGRVSCAKNRDRWRIRHISKTFAALGYDYYTERFLEAVLLSMDNQKTVRVHAAIQTNQSFRFWIIPKFSAPAPLDKGLSSRTKHEQTCWNGQVTQGLHENPPISSRKRFSCSLCMRVLMRRDVHKYKFESMSQFLIFEEFLRQQSISVTKWSVRFLFSNFN